MSFESHGVSLAALKVLERRAQEFFTNRRVALHSGKTAIVLNGNLIQVREISKDNSIIRSFKNLEKAENIKCTIKAVVGDRIAVKSTDNNNKSKSKTQETVTLTIGTVVEVDTTDTNNHIYTVVICANLDFTHEANHNLSWTSGKRLKVSNANCCPLTIAGFTTKDACEELIMPAMLQSKKSLVERLDFGNNSIDDDPSGLIKELLALPSPAFGKASVFVSHAWKYAFPELVNAIALSKNVDSVNDFFWVDICTVNQVEQTSFPPDYFYTTFSDGIRSIGKTLLVLLPWFSPIPLTRAWCLWEIIATIQAPDAKLVVDMSPAQSSNLRDWIANGGNGGIIALIEGIDVSTAEARSDSDRLRILQSAQNAPGGIAGINSAIKNQLRAWMVATVQSTVLLNKIDTKMMVDKQKQNKQDKQREQEEQEKQGEQDKEQRNSLSDTDKVTKNLDVTTGKALSPQQQHMEEIQSAAMILWSLGEVDLANTYYEFAHQMVGNVEWWRSSGTSPEGTISAKSRARFLTNYGSFLSKGLNSPFKAKVQMEASLALKVETLGDTHPDVFYSLYNLATVLEMIPNKWDNGKDINTMYRRALAIADLHSTTNPVFRMKSLKVRMQLAKNLMRKNNYEQNDVEEVRNLAAGIMKSAEATGTIIGGKDEALRLLADIEFRLGNFNGALKLDRDIHALYLENIGVYHRKTIETHNSIALMLRKLKKYDEAEKEYLALLEISLDSRADLKGTTQTGSRTIPLPLVALAGMFWKDAKMYRRAVPYMCRICKHLLPLMCMIVGVVTASILAVWMISFLFGYVFFLVGIGNGNGLSLWKSTAVPPSCFLTFAILMHFEGHSRDFIIQSSVLAALVGWLTYLARV